MLFYLIVYSKKSKYFLFNKLNTYKISNQYFKENLLVQVKIYLKRYSDYLNRIKYLLNMFGVNPELTTLVKLGLKVLNDSKDCYCYIKDFYDEQKILTNNTIKISDKDI